MKIYETNKKHPKVENEFNIRFIPPLMITTPLTLLFSTLSDKYPLKAAKIPSSVYRLLFHIVGFGVILGNKMMKKGDYDDS